MQGGGDGRPAFSGSGRRGIRYRVFGSAVQPGAGAGGAAAGGIF